MTLTDKRSPGNLLSISRTRRLTVTAQAKVVCLAAPIMDLVDALSPSERDAIDRAVDKRRREFATGRWLAHRALEQLGVPAESIPVGSQREPVWPPAVVGSISHTQGQAVVAASVDPSVVGLGLDLEAMGRVDERMIHQVMTAGEIDRLADVDPTLIFSAKEACYKLLFPLFREFVGFHAVEIDVDTSDSSFRANYVGSNSKLRVIASAKGRFQQFEGCWLTCMVLLR